GGEPTEPKEGDAGTGEKPENKPGADEKNDGDAGASKEKKPDGKAGTDENKEGDQGADGSDEEKKPAGPSREEIAQKQADVVVEAADIQRITDKMNGLTDLAKGRIAEALKTAELASGALERGDTKEASKAVEKASGMFREVARNVEALAARETAQKIAMARNISEELSQSERDLAAELERQQQPGTGSGDPPKKGEKPKPGQGDKPSEDPDNNKGSGPGKE